MMLDLYALPPKEYLGLFMRYKAKASNIEAELSDLADTLGPVALDSMPGKGVISHPTEAAALKLIETRKRYQAELEEADAICNDVLDTINSLEDAKSSKLLYLKYCKDMPWALVADELHYSVAYVKQELHAIALDQLKIQMQRKAMAKVGGM